MKNDFRLFLKVFSMTIISILIIIIFSYLIYRNHSLINQVIAGLAPKNYDTQETIGTNSASSTIEVYTPYPLGNYTNNPTVIQDVSIPTPTQYVERGWSQKVMAINGFLIEIPDNWRIEEIATNSDDTCGIGKGLANYRLRDYGDYQNILIQSTCGYLVDGEGSYCPPETQILDEKLGIARWKLKPNDFEYSHFTRENNNISCLGGWLISNNIYITASYTSRAEIDLATADYIILSIHNN